MNQTFPPQWAGSTTAWQSLDGDWQIIFDRENAGVERSWHEHGVFAGLSSRTIPVPSCWEVAQLRSGRVIAPSAAEEDAITGALQTDDVVATATVELFVPPGGLTVRQTLKLESVIPWSPDNPHLYCATVPRQVPRAMCGEFVEQRLRPYAG